MLEVYNHANPQHKDNSEMSLILQTLERQVVTTAMRRLTELGWIVGSMIYDGFFVERRSVAVNLSTLAQWVEGVTGLRVVFADEVL